MGFEFLKVNYSKKQTKNPKEASAEMCFSFWNVSGKHALFFFPPKESSHKKHQEYIRIYRNNTWSNTIKGRNKP